MKTTALALAVLALFGALTAYMVSEADAGGNTAAMDAMSIDMNTAGNTATSLGTRQSCQRINENNSLDADETSTDTLTFDVTATNIPVSNPMIAFAYQIAYEEAALTIQTANHGFLLAFTPGSSLFGGNDVTPDVNGDDVFAGSALDTADFTVSLPESGSGVLQRHTISSDFGAAPQQYPLVFDPSSAAIHINSSASAVAANSVNNATIAIGEPCGGGPPTPTPSPTASPTTAPSSTATPSPTATGAPTPDPSGTPGGPTPTPTQAPGPTDTPAPSGTGGPTPTTTPTPIPTPLPSGVTPEPTPTASPEPTPLPSGVTPAPTPTATPGTSETPGPSQSPGGKPKGSVDCDLDVDSIDALHVLRFVGGLGAAACIAEADVDCDGDRDATDALKILRHVADLDVALPDGCVPIGTMVA